ncbi:MAG: acyltransferase family protein [Verrucomicrobia bacterium]|nr:acyltransferase family protein [Verrucomicrobiota bacterium]
MNKTNRYYGLDLIRSGALLLGLVIHVSIFFMDDQGLWMMGEHLTDPFNRLIVTFIHLFRMQLFFLLAGFFAQMVIEKNGILKFIEDRKKRILIPFLFAIVFLVPIHHLIISAAGQPSLVRKILMEKPILECVNSVLLYGGFSKNSVLDFIGFWHYWFIYYLIIMYLAHVIMRLVLPTRIKVSFCNFLGRITEKPMSAIWLGFLCFPINFSLSEIDLPPNHFNFEINNLASYMTFYFVGIGLYVKRENIEHLKKNCFIYLGIGLLTVPFCMQLTPLAGDLYPSVVHDLLSYKVVGFRWVKEAALEGGIFKSSVVLLRSCVAWLFSLGFIGLAERYFKKENLIIKYISDASYWMFYSHLLLTFTLSYMLAKVNVLNSLTKSGLILTVSFYIMWWSYNVFVRYTVLGDYFMGRRKARNSNMSDNHISTTDIIKFTWRPVLIGLFAFYVLGESFKTEALLQGKEFLNEARIAQTPGIFNTQIDLSQLRDRFRRTPLHLAAASPKALRDYNPIYILLPHFKDVDALDIMNRTALFNAVRIGNLDDVQLLIDAGANPNKADSYGHTPAHVAAIKVEPENTAMSEQYLLILKFLKYKGANFDLKDYRNRTVSDCLKEFSGRTFIEIK